MAGMILVAAASIGMFLWVFRQVGVIPIARGALATTRGAIRTMRDPDLEDLAREHAVRSAAVSLVAASGSLILRSAVALMAAFVPIVAADWAGIVGQSAMISFMERWDVILIATVVVTLGYLGLRIWSP